MVTYLSGCQQSFKIVLVYVLYHIDASFVHLGAKVNKMLDLVRQRMRRVLDNDVKQNRKLGHDGFFKRISKREVDLWVRTNVVGSPVGNVKTIPVPSERFYSGSYTFARSKYFV